MTAPVREENPGILSLIPRLFCYGSRKGAENTTHHANTMQTRGQIMNRMACAYALAAGAGLLFGPMTANTALAEPLRASGGLQIAVAAQSSGAANSTLDVTFKGGAIHAIELYLDGGSGKQAGHPHPRRSRSHQFFAGWRHGRLASGSCQGIRRGRQLRHCYRSMESGAAERRCSGPLYRR